MWLAAVSVMSIDDRSHLPQPLVTEAVGYRTKLNPGMLLAVNLPLVFGALLASHFRRKAFPSTLETKRAIARASELLLVFWILIVANPY